ncbi:MAG TPA: DUF2147 domain-containing protein [Saprospiraceae bacterium]|nr:DUF2147 domain-containing protein [Saprospiraceae bacterium]HQW55202.1 DUF2147 domain-containing protein [Saprospiraceae bacterium]
MRSIFFIIFCLVVVASRAQSPEGTWLTIDDNTGKAKSWVEIYKVNNEYYGKVVKLLEGVTTSVCTKCTGDKKDKPIVGMVILTHLKVYTNYWKGGEILDPKTGNTYGCSIWFENNNYNQLYVRGKHWSGLFRDQTWKRVE